VDDPAILRQSKMSTAINGSVGIFLVGNGHDPVEKDMRWLNKYGFDLHAELFAASGQAFAQGSEICDPFYPLDAILENDLLMIVRENVGPIWFPLTVVGLRPKFAKQIGSEWRKFMGIYRLVSRICHRWFFSIVLILRRAIQYTLIQGGNGV